MPTLAALTLYAHQGGWDEILFVLAPLLIFAGLLVMARRRVDRMAATDADDRGGDDAATEGEGDERSRTT